MNRRLAVTAAATFVGLVVASNWLTAEYGLIGGFIAAGTFTAGLVLQARDVVRDHAGQQWRRWIAGCIATGAGLSALMTFAAGSFPGGPSPLRLAVASAVAFTLSELADTLVYEPLRQRGRDRARAASNAVGSVIDSVLFLVIAGFPLWPAVAGQVGGKWLVSVVLPLGIAKLFRRRTRRVSWRAA